MSDYFKYSDNDLLELIQKENHQAFTEVYNRYWKELYISALRHLKNEMLAEEVVQEIFISFYLKRGKIVIKESLRGYLYTLVKHKVLNEIRSAITRNNYKESLEKVEKTADENPLDQLSLAEIQQAIDNTIRQLPDKCQEAYCLSRYENLSHQNVAEKMGISVSTVEKHIVKALKVLRQNVSHYYFLLIILLK